MMSQTFCFVSEYNTREEQQGDRAWKIHLIKTGTSGGGVGEAWA